MNKVKRLKMPSHASFVGEMIDKSVDIKKHVQTHTSKKEYKIECKDCEYVGILR